MLAVNVGARDGSALLYNVIVNFVHLAAFEMAVVVQKGVQSFAGTKTASPNSFRIDIDE